MEFVSELLCESDILTQLLSENGIGAMVSYIFTYCDSRTICML